MERGFASAWALAASGLVASSYDDELASSAAREAVHDGGPVAVDAVGKPDGGEARQTPTPVTATACDGALLPTCAPGWTGPGCALRCDGESCDFASYCHGDGRTWGLASFGGYLFPASASLPDQALHSRLEGFIVEHPDAVGLEAGISPEHLDLVPAKGFRAPAGKLTLLRFEQQYRGIPVYGPDGTVRVTLAPGGAIAFDGAIVDGRDVWASLDLQASEEVARRSILMHAVERSGLSEEQLEVAGLRRVAVPTMRRIGWVGTVRAGVGHVATIVVDADPEASLPLPILHVEHIEAAGLDNEVDIGVLGEEPASDVFSPPDQAAGLGQLFDGSPLRGSTSGTDVILGTERVVGYDASGAMSLPEIEIVPPLASAMSAFAAIPGTVAYDVQNHYVRVQSFYSFADRYMAGVWDSINVASSFPPGEFEPRVMLWISPGFDACRSASFCASYVPLEGMAPGQVADEYVHSYSGLDLENLGNIAIETGGAAAHVLAHEFGHTVDLFAAPYSVDTGLGCLGMPGCAPSCQLDTTEEAPTLREAVAQLFAIAATSALYPVATFENCDPLLRISHGSDAAPHSDACRPDGEPYSHFLPVTCPPGTGFCDHDFDIGFEMGQPTGLCNSSNGYRTDSFHQAFWEIFHAQRCAPTPPYTCTPMSLPAGLSASDAFMPALLYALRVDAKSFRQFVDAFATHVSCNLDSDVYEEVDEVLCHHDLRACEALPPATCRMCDNGVREVGEVCDGNDLGGETCQSLGFDGGVLACNASCMLDTMMCQTMDTGLDSTGASGPADPGVEATGPETSLGDETSNTSAGSREGGGGCECSTRADRGTDVAVLGLGLFGWVAARRRRARTAVAALAAMLATMGTQGCCDPTIAMATSSMGESSTPSESGTTDSTSSTGEPALPEWAIGFFSTESDKVGMSFMDQPYGWANIEITAMGTLFLDGYNCSLHREQQEFRWTSVDGGERLNLQPVPPADVFTYGAGHQVSEVVVEPGDSCDTIIIRWFQVEAMAWFVDELQRGSVCAKTTGPDGCTFTFEWCDGLPPAPCE